MTCTKFAMNIDVIKITVTESDYTANLQCVLSLQDGGKTILKGPGSK